MALKPAKKIQQQTSKNQLGQAQKLTKAEKISKNRGQAWKNSVAQGMLDGQRNPSRLRNNRLMKLMTQSEMATQVRLSKSTYAMIERRTRTVDLQRATVISSFFKVKVEYLFSKNQNNKYVAI